ncbi:cytochrome P450 [Dactylosporangium sp. NPDC005572]|uniref:cytochrome P450 n=1 Tax=Dactylosporangium sp. NPDC005572 TaxID=3156889 RepID=UPI0033B5CFA8
MVREISLPDGSPAWLVTRYADVRAGLADPRLSLDKRNSAGGYAGFSLPPRLDANLLNMDDPDHARIRRVVGPAFSPRRVLALRPALASLAGSFSFDGPFDVVADYATPLSLAVIGELLGVSRDDLSRLRSSTTALMGGSPDAAAAIEAFLVELISLRRAQPGDDLLSAMIAAPLSPDELTSLAFLTIFAGYENSINLIANCVLLLLERPAILAAVRGDEELLRAAVDETLRFEPPAPVSIRRFATAELTFGDVTVPAGATVLLGIAAANRDPAVFDAPDEFRLRRPAAPHLALGHGPHHCLGAALAVVSATEAVGALLARHPGLTLRSSRWRPSLRTRSLEMLLVSP